MCGIVGYIGSERSAEQVLLDGLTRLEYRGYDSAGVAIWDGAALRVARKSGKLEKLKAKLEGSPLGGSVGIGHTRWATHGRASDRNAHPHCAGPVALVHNGIVENYRQLRSELEAEGCRILSETDTELVAQLIARNLKADGDLLTAVRTTARALIGSFALAVMSSEAPEQIVVGKFGGSPVIIGFGEGETYFASDAAALLPYTRKMHFLRDGEFAVLTREHARVVDAQGNPLPCAPRTIEWDPVSVEKGGYDHFMQKEIFEQPRAVRDTIGARIREDAPAVELEGIDLSPERVRALRRVTLVACGSSYYACLIGRYLIESIAGLPADVDLSSEFRYRQPTTLPGSLLLPVSQSGETADTLAALREGRERGAQVLAVCNTRFASITQESDEVLYTVAGPEIGVASTKCFSTQIVALYLLALGLGSARGRLDDETLRRRLEELRQLPRRMEETLAQEQQVRAAARRYCDAQNFLFLGRGVMYPIALEGALKLKEISYIHAEGYAAGEMKHGPIALIDRNMPVVVIANQSPVYEKVLSNLEEVRARDAQIIAVASIGDTEIEARADVVLRIPELGEPLSALLAVLPLQLLAYHMATLRGTDVDQPRNLAKSVTVE